MDLDHVALRRQVLRRVRYAKNWLALEADLVPPEGPFDTALTNGLLAIVAEEWPGEEVMPDGKRMKAASELLRLVEDSGGLPLVDVAVLRDGLRLTQPFRHGRADDEWAAIDREHIEALRALDEHRALRFIESARPLSLDQAIVEAYRERAEEELPFDPKDRMDVPDPRDCDSCGRWTFLASGWDDFGRDNGPGFCLACGYELDADRAHELAVFDQMEWHLSDDS